SRQGEFSPLKQDQPRSTQPRPKLSRVSGVLIASSTHASHYRAPPSLVALTLHASHYRAHRNGIAVCIARDGLRHPTIHSIADLPDGVHVACGCLGQQCPSYLTQSLMIIPRSRNLHPQRISVWLVSLLSSGVSHL